MMARLEFHLNVANTAEELLLCRPSYLGTKKERIASVTCHDRALEYIGIAVEDGGGLLYSHFIAFKVHLEKVSLSNILQSPTTV